MTEDPEWQRITGGRHTRRTEWAVRYKRAGWPSARSKIYQTEPPARRYAARLLESGPTGTQWAPITELTVEMRDVTPWRQAEQ
jgi:hypothetical protein